MFEHPTQPLVSIIMPTYNRAKYIIETIQSIQKQTYKNWELVIVDDGSEDNTAELISQIKDDRVIFLEAGRIGIVGKLKNMGIENSCGEFIAFNDSDDLWETSKLEKQIQALKDYPGAGFCLTGGYNFKNLNDPVEYFYKEREGKKFGDFFISVFQSRIACFTQTLMIRKECIHKAGVFKESGIMSDADFITKLCCHLRGVLLYEPLVYRRLHEENYIHSNWIGSYYEGIAIIEHYRKQNLLPGNIASEALFKLYINFGEDYLHRKKSWNALIQFLNSWKYKPFSLVPVKKSGKAILKQLA